MEHFISSYMLKSEQKDGSVGVAVTKGLPMANRWTTEKVPLDCSFYVQLNLIEY